MSRDDQHVVAEATPIKVFEHGEGVRSHGRQERISRAVEKLERRHVGLEVAVRHELGYGVGIAHLSTWLTLIPQAVGVPDAVGTVQRTTLDVVQAEAALAILDNFAGALGQTGKLRWRQQRDDDTHAVLFRRCCWEVGRAPLWQRRQATTA